MATAEHPVDQPVPARGYAASPPLPLVDIHAGEIRVGARSGAAAVIVGVIALAVAALAGDQQLSTGWLVAFCGIALASGATLIALDAIGTLNLPMLAAFDLFLIGVVTLLVERTGGTSSAYAAVLIFVVIHAAAFQPRVELTVVLVAAVAAFLAPSVYDDAIDQRYDDIVFVAIPAVVVGALLIHTAVSALRAQRARSIERETEALRLAEQDALTGLGNYRMFSRALEAETARARRYGDNFSLVLLDLNGFKAINDDLGHAEGDRALQVVADGLRSALRAEDVLCRQGGDEFAVIAVRAGPAEGHDLAVRLVDAVTEATADRRLPRPVTASAGWATFGRHANSTEELIICADAALRRVKRMGGGPEVGNPEEPRPEGAEDAGVDGTPSDVAALTTLASVARALAVSESPGEIAAAAVAHLAGAIDTLEARALRWDRAGNALELVAFSGRRGETDPDLRVPDDRGLLGVAVRECRSVIVADGHHHAATVPGSELAVPVLVGDAVWGVLYTCSDRADAYDTRDLKLAEAMADQVGRALAGAWVIERLAASEGVDAPWLADAVDAPGAAPSAVADLAVKVGTALGLDEQELEDLRRGALFHDIGTLAVPAGVLHKPGRLTEHERAVVRDHVVFGERMLSRVPEMRGAARLVRHAHERVDGSGYPDGLAGTEIPLGSRILLACDAYISMTSTRPYRPPLTHAQAIGELRRTAGTQLDRDVVDVLLSLLNGPRLVSVSGAEVSGGADMAVD